MANTARGEVELQLGGGTYIVALGLGVLAELEDTFDVDSFEDALNTIFTEKLSARRLRKFIVALLKGNGVAITDEVNRHLDGVQPGDLLTISNALVKMMNNSGLTQQSTEERGQSVGASPLTEGSAGDSGSK